MLGWLQKLCIRGMQVDADWDEDEDDAEEEEGAEQGRAGGAAGPGKRQKEKKTRAQRNRQGRAKDAAAELAVRRGLKRQRRQLDALPAIQVGHQCEVVTGC